MHYAPHRSISIVGRRTHSGQRWINEKRPAILTAGRFCDDVCDTALRFEDFASRLNGEIHQCGFSGKYFSNSAISSASYAPAYVPAKKRSIASAWNWTQLWSSWPGLIGK